MNTILVFLLKATCEGSAFINTQVMDDLVLAGAGLVGRQLHPDRRTQISSTHH